MGLSSSPSLAAMRVHHLSATRPLTQPRTKILSFSRRKQMPGFEALRTAVEEAIVARANPQAVTHQAAPNIAEQVQQLATLRDQGLLSSEEFEAKKSELLQRM